MTSGRVIARSTAWTFGGQAAPLAVAFFTIPVLITSLGQARFGMLTLAWLLIGYFNLFDLGLGRALTQIVAERLGSGQERSIPSLVWTGLLLMMGLGLVGAAILVPLTPWLVRNVLRVPYALQREGWQAFSLLAVALPFVIGSAGLRGVLEARQQFGAVSLVGAVMGSFTFAGPLLLLYWCRTLVPIVMILVIGRIVMWSAYFLLCLGSVPSLGNAVVIRRAEMGPLLRFGGWMTVTSIIGPLMVSLDRFLIGCLISVEAVTYYAAPYEIVTKVWIIPQSFVRVLFPAFATSIAHDSSRTKVLFDRSIRITMLLLWPIILTIVILAGDALTVWLGADIARHSTRVMQWIAIGVLFNCPGQVAFALIQGMGRPDLTAKIHLGQLPIYLVLLGWSLGRFGIEGAAVAWTGRVLIDTTLLLIVASRLLPGRLPAWRTMKWLVVGALPTMFLVVPPLGLAANCLTLFLLLAAFIPITWCWGLHPDERAALWRRIDMNPCCTG